MIGCVALALDQAALALSCARVSHVRFQVDLSLGTLRKYFHSYWTLITCARSPSLPYCSSGSRSFCPNAHRTGQQVVTPVEHEKAYQMPPAGPRKPFGLAVSGGGFRTMTAGFAYARAISMAFDEDRAALACGFFRTSPPNRTATIGARWA